MTEKQKQGAIKEVKNILNILHEKQYEELPFCMDIIEWDDLEEVTGSFESFFDEFKDVYKSESFDEELKEENLQFEEYSDGFKVIYNLTCDGILADWELRLMFQYEDEKMQSVLGVIEYA